MATPRLLKRIMAFQASQWIVSAIGSGYALVVRWTSRIDLPPPPAGGPFIIAMWHGRLAMLHLLRFGERPLVALISGHRDGQLISKCAWYYHIQTVTGSSSSGGIGAARRLVRLAREGHNLFITPDGPRGPCMLVNEGIVDLSLLTGLPILPAAISTSGGKELRTWDRFLIPQPFSRIAIRWGEPLCVDRSDDPAALSARLEKELNALQQSADRAVDRVTATSTSPAIVAGGSGRALAARKIERLVLAVGEARVGGAERRLKALKSLIEHARDRLGLDLGFVLWDGSTVPPGLPRDALAIRIADEGAVAALLRHPNLETLGQLWVTRRVDLHNGTLLDLARVRPRVHSREFRKTLDKGLLLKAAAKFLLVPRGGPWPLEEQPSERPSDGSPAENKKNIAHHYDVSNAFYALWLDKEMVYTCGYCTDWNNDIDRMQHDKLEMTCRKLRLKPGERLLDIGCGWGALSMYAVQKYGVTAYAVTLSEKQVAYGQEKLKRLGLGDHMRMECKDYSTVEGEFDKVAAIGLQEHVGMDNYPKYYETVRRVLKHDGLFLQQATARPAKRNNATFRRKRPEFALLTKHVFPGGEFDYIGNTLTMLERHGFEVHDLENWREHYQRTCRHWHDRLLANYDAAVREVGEVKTRMWLAYLGLSSISFERNTVCLFQTLASKKRRGPSGLPPTRADLYR